MEIAIDIPVNTIKGCVYCKRQIYFDYCGWGLMFDDHLQRLYFHNECMNMTEGVAIA